MNAAVESTELLQGIQLEVTNPQISDISKSSNMMDVMEGHGADVLIFVVGVVFGGVLVMFVQSVVRRQRRKKMTSKDVEGLIEKQKKENIAKKHKRMRTISSGSGGGYKRSIQSLSSVSSMSIGDDAVFETPEKTSRPPALHRSLSAPQFGGMTPNASNVALHTIVEIDEEVRSELGKRIRALDRAHMEVEEGYDSDEDENVTFFI